MKRILIHNNRGVVLLMALVLLIVMGSLASIFVLNLSSGFSLSHKQIKSQIAFNLAEAGIEKAIWHLRQPGAGYEGERDTRLGDGTFTVSVVNTHPDIKEVTVISRGFYPDSEKPQAECMLMAILDAGKGIKVLLWKQISHGEINKFKRYISKGDILTVYDATILAARLANDECERLYGKRPFYPNLYPAELEGTTWHWGRLDPGGVDGFSAKVSFTLDGSYPKVEIYYSTDTLQQPKIPIRPYEDRNEIFPEENSDLLIDKIIKK